jgi:hypothetical protein
LLQQIIKPLLKVVFFILIKGQFYWVLALIYRKFLRKVQPDGSRIPCPDKSRSRLKVLALSPSEFRNDPLALAQNEDVCVIELPDVWLSRLMFQFYSTEVPRQFIKRYLEPDESDECFKAKRNFRKFLTGFLPVFYRMTDIDCVISHHILYIADNDWGEISDSLGHPYFVIHREGVSGDRDSYEFERFAKFLREMKNFHFKGSRFLTQNDLVGELFTAGGIINPEQATTVGTLRMDSFLRAISEEPKELKIRNRLVFFPFTVGGITLEADTYPTFCKTLEIFANVARKRPDIEVIIKPKGPERWFRPWKKDADQAFAQAGIEPDKIKNLIINWDLDPHELILSADVVSGINTTTILEAGVAGRAVVVPYFDKLRDPKYDDRIYLRTELHRFDVGETAEQFEQLLLERIESPFVPVSVLVHRQQMFNKYVSSTEANATERTILLMQGVVDKMANIRASY